MYDSRCPLTKKEADTKMRAFTLPIFALLVALSLGEWVCMVKIGEKLEFENAAAAINNIKWSSSCSKNFYSLALDPCYTEENVMYKVLHGGLENLVKTTKDSAEECRTYCRHVL